MRQTSFLLLLMLVFSAGACAATGADDRPERRIKTMFPTYTNRSENPEVWDGIAGALRNAGLSDAIAAIRVRESAVWSSHVDLKPMSGRPPVRAIVSFNLNKWTILCFTSEVEDCSKYGR